jgi:spermidine/putrescine transport system substrate-binding protein
MMRDDAFCIKPHWIERATGRLGVLSALLILVAIVLAACDSANPPPAPPSLAKELVLYNWVDYMPQAVLDAFTAEYGVKVIYQTYDSMEETVASIQAGKSYDVAVVENDHLPSLVADGLLAEIDYRNVPNFKNISASFRDLIFDPGNEHSVPYNWGTNGLLVRTDLVEDPVTRWADLWNPQYAGKIATRAVPKELISIALKSLGYSGNSEDPTHWQAAQERLLALKPSLIFVEVEADKAVSKLSSGEAVILNGWSGDAPTAMSQNPAIHYVLPEEGAFLWGDSFVISANSPNQYTAEVFLNYLLRPEISAQIVNKYFYATANEAALPFIQPEIRNNPLIFLSKEDMGKAEWFLPSSAERERRSADIWKQFMAADGH